MSYKLVRYKTQHYKARKDFVCFVCGKDIKKGSKFVSSNISGRKIQLCFYCDEEGKDERLYFKRPGDSKYGEE